ncbi:MAG: hypothetical protein ACYDCQ_00430 [Dehalococcoidia bacterium]
MRWPWGPVAQAAAALRRGVPLDSAIDLDRALVEELATLRFVTEAAKVLLIGPPAWAKPTW